MEMLVPVLGILPASHSKTLPCTSDDTALLLASTEKTLGVKTTHDLKTYGKKVQYTLEKLEFLLLMNWMRMIDPFGFVQGAVGQRGCGSAVVVPPQVYPLRRAATAAAEPRVSGCSLCCELLQHPEQTTAAQGDGADRGYTPAVRVPVSRLPPLRIKIQPHRTPSHC